MPWSETSPLAAGISSATGYYAQKQANTDRQLALKRQADLDAQTAALTGAQIGNYQSEAKSRGINDKLNQQAVIVHPGEIDPLTGQPSKFGNAAYQQAIAQIHKGTLDAQTAAYKAKSAAIDAQFKPVMDQLNMMYRAGQITEQKYKTITASVDAQYQAALKQATLADDAASRAEHLAGAAHSNALTSRVGQPAPGHSLMDDIMRHAAYKSIDQGFATPKTQTNTYYSSSMAKALVALPASTRAKVDFAARTNSPQAVYDNLKAIASGKTTSPNMTAAEAQSVVDALDATPP